MKIKALSLAVVCLTFNHIAYAYEELQTVSDNYFDDFYGSEEMVEIATGIKTQIYKAPAIASVITAEQIKFLGATDIDDVLETVPGLHITRVSSSYLPIYTFRGVYSSYNPQVLMLINGIPITNNFLGNRNQNWLGMPVETIARLEVIRGPGSAVFGSDAFSGVINIVTKSADDITTDEIGVRVGDYNTQDAWFSVAGQSSDIKYALTFELHNTKGYDGIVSSDAQTRLDGIFGTDASLAPGRLSLGVESYDVRAEVNYDNLTVRAGIQKRTGGGLGAGLGEALDPNANKASDRMNLDVNYKADLNDNLSVDMQLAYFDTSQDINNNYTIYPAGAQLGSTVYEEGLIGNPEVWERHYRLNTTALYTGISDHTIRFGMGYHKGDMYKTKESKNFGLGPDGIALPPGSPVVDVSDTPYIFLRESERSNYHAFVQDIWTIANDWEVTAGIRVDDYSDFGRTTNPRLAVVWSTSLNLSTKLLYGKAFRAPSFAELGNINNPVTLGNPNLQPEEMETIELAFDYHPRDEFGVIVSFYSYKWNDIIQFVPDENANSSTAQNFGEQTGYGAEIEFNWQVMDNVKVSSNYAFSKAENDLTNKDVSYVAGNQLYFQVDWQMNEELSMHIRNHFIADRKRESLDPRDDIDDYWLTNATFRWQPTFSDIEYALIAKNIFDVDAREPSLNSGSNVNLPDDLPLPGMSVLAEVRVQF